jgi:hypothetical protein
MKPSKTPADRQFPRSLIIFLINSMRRFRITFAAVVWFVLLQSLVAKDSARIIVYLPWDSLQHSHLRVSLDVLSC